MYREQLLRSGIASVGLLMYVFFWKREPSYELSRQKRPASHERRVSVRATVLGRIDLR